ncbi:hypothetical protein H5410_051414 [Solanum commersonii]|uniref:Uncharacterized protein n=1 Tax=Solanum commersonii TaxID=4109 RepID=A0A9J5WYC1_SOLCO|nr:hypothetical protein H5410_051414 [Solanum commersonii]
MEGKSNGWEQDQILEGHLALERQHGRYLSRYLQPNHVSIKHYSRSMVITRMEFHVQKTI